MPAIICDLKAIGGTLRKQPIDDRWQSAKFEPEPTAANHAWYDPFGSVYWPQITPMSDLVTRLRTHAREVVHRATV